jgi:hypothetical protein
MLGCMGRSKQADEFPLSPSTDPLKLSAGFQMIIWKKPSPAAVSIRDVFIQTLGAAWYGAGNGSALSLYQEAF